MNIELLVLFLCRWALGRRYKHCQWLTSTVTSGRCWLLYQPLWSIPGWKRLKNGFQRLVRMPSIWYIMDQISGKFVFVNFLRWCGVFFCFEILVGNCYSLLSRAKTEAINSHDWRLSSPWCIFAADDGSLSWIIIKSDETLTLEAQY